MGKKEKKEEPAKEQEAEGIEKVFEDFLQILNEEKEETIKVRLLISEMQKQGHTTEFQEKEVNALHAKIRMEQFPKLKECFKAMRDEIYRLQEKGKTTKSLEIYEAFKKTEKG